MKNTWGVILLAIWLIAFGATLALNMHFDYQGIILGVLAIVAGVFLLLGK